ncbi:amidohydrolase [Bacillus sp. FJAT-27231]|uniref:amidohydrolase n=1 Tax=Bacillus sp. FJAT-27231 TaxID=1679168 RepID=UPI000671321A|nr:amidohydrolase [Bacillus sp. FJAT-27231]KMY56160.1 amidohydrolase [Bacillus sp. FJAT-27231]
MNNQYETTFINGKIFTSNPNQPYASAMKVQDGKITWIGNGEEIEQCKGNVIDLQGRRVLPGFIDAHLHPWHLAMYSKQIAALPPNVHSIAELIEQIRERRKSLKEGQWIECWGYDEGKLAEGRMPTRWDLDEAAPDVPVIASRSCVHIATVNSKVLEMAGITKDTPNPPGGQIDKDENGEPTGVLRENAREIVFKLMPVQTMEEDAAALAELSPKLFAHGITAITDLMSRTAPVDYLEMYKKGQEKGLKQRTVLYYMWEDLRMQPIEDKERINRNNPVHIGGIKLFSDGSISGQTAWVNPPFLGEGENYGIPTTSKEELLAAGEAAKKYGIQLVIHAMGEQAIDLIVDTFYDKEGWLEDAPSVRIEHVTLPTQQAMKRMAEARIGIVTQPVFLYAEIESYLKNLGAERTKETYPIKTMLEMGIEVAFSSDAPGTAWADPVNPFLGLKSAVTRKAYEGTDTGQDERIDVATAIELYTRAAQQLTRIPQVGQLKPGYHADFIVLDQDILEINPENIDEVQVVETYMDGNCVYQKEAAVNN